jgi:hypothetical protein
LKLLVIKFARIGALLKVADERFSCRSLAPSLELLDTGKELAYNRF